MKISIEHEITTQQIVDLVTMALEGGSNYWIDAVISNRKELGVDFLADVLFHPTGVISFYAEEGEEKHPLTLEICVAGIRLMAEQYPQHMKDLIEENDDADTADCFLQLALFKEVIFG